jgi:predicted SprT family Zn-dependent metalloprotease
MPVIRVRLRPDLWGKVQIKVREFECGDCTGRKNCGHKYTYRCKRCGKEIFDDEELELNGLGEFHYRCREEAMDRPIHMHVFPCQ